MPQDRAGSPLATDVENRYESEFLGKFPYNDCYALQKTNPELAAAIIPDLDQYLSFIAGYSSSATRLSARSRDELRHAIEKLKKSFFDVHPKYTQLEQAFSQKEALRRTMKVANELRMDLVIIMERLG